VNKKLFLLFFFLIISIPQIYADEIFITKSDISSEIVFDGIWTFTKEWKKSTEKKILLDNEILFVLKTFHDSKNIFFLIDVLSDTSKNKLGDRAIVCFDTLNDKGNRPKVDDYCFQVSLDGNLTTLIGDSNNAQSGYYKKIKNLDGVKALGGISNEFDRYSKTPHVSYEFQIPTDLIGRSSEYGFYVGVFNAQTNEIFSWPQNSLEERYPFIPSPEQWGILISPDKSLPEFSFSMIFFILIPIFLGFALITKNRFLRLYIE